jgi:hypothetical protein
MTLAVIVGLWGLLFPKLIARESPASGRFALQVATQTQENPSSSQPEPQATPVQPNTTTQKPDATPPAQAPPKPKRHTHKKKPAAQPNDPPEKVVIRNGSTSEPDVKLSPPMSPNQSSNQLKKTDDLLAGTQENLKQISGRTLNPTQQETVKQIEQYMDQARKAISDGDLDRGRNLAFKAHLLSDDLVKH